MPINKDSKVPWDKAKKIVKALSAELDRREITYKPIKLRVDDGHMYNDVALYVGPEPHSVPVRLSARTTGSYLLNHTGEITITVGDYGFGKKHFRDRKAGHDIMAIVDHLAETLKHDAQRRKESRERDKRVRELDAVMDLVTEKGLPPGAHLSRDADARHFSFTIHGLDAHALAQVVAVVKTVVKDA